MKITDPFITCLTAVRKRVKISGCIGIGLLFWVGIPSSVAKDAPDWLIQAAASTLPEYEENVSYVVLQDDLSVEIDNKGRIKKTRTYAVKILQKEGKAHALAKEIYKTDTDKVRKFLAWLLPPDGDIRKYDKEDIIDAALVNNDIYNDVRVKLIPAANEAVEGSIFGYEYVVEERSVFSQFEWFFHLYEPSVISRFSVVLPDDWTLDASTFNRPEIAPAIHANMYTWELQDLPAIEYEPLSPAIENIVPRLVVSVFPPTRQVRDMPSFRSWTDVSQWMTSLVEPEVVFDDTMADRAEALIANAHSEIEKTGAIARFCQNIKYISIQTGIGRGGGYQPHPSTETFEKGYGDCKDKTNLMRALLRAVGIAAYPVSVYSGDRFYVREEWPSPQQFNHSVIAIEVSEDTNLSAVYKHEKLGSLLIFDPTDNYTHLGDIAGHIQGGLALLIAGKNGGLFRLPASGPQDNRTERTINIELSANGSIQAGIHEKLYGDSASGARAEYYEQSQDDFKRMIQEWIADSVLRADISRMDFQPDSDAGAATFDVQFSAPRYGQLIQDNKLLFNTNIVSRRDSIALTEPSRKLPIVIEPVSLDESVYLKIPSGFSVRELPVPVTLEQDFGTYRTKYEINEETLVYNRSLVTRQTILPVDQYNVIRQFYISVRDSEQSPIVLVKD
jgi:transglutaminase-like putative cysteine protease